MNKKCILAGLIALGLFPLTLSTTAAHAGVAAQTFCNSNNSAGQIIAEGRYLGRGQCYRTENMGAFVTINNNSFRVAYDGGPWSSCKKGQRQIDPDYPPRTYWVKTYSGSNC